MAATDFSVSHSHPHFGQNTYFLPPQPSFHLSNFQNRKSWGLGNGKTRSKTSSRWLFEKKSITLRHSNRHINETNFRQSKRPPRHQRRYGLHDTVLHRFLPFAERHDTVGHPGHVSAAEGQLRLQRSPKSGLSRSSSNWPPPCCNPLWDVMPTATHNLTPYPPECASR